MFVLRAAMGAMSRLLDNFQCNIVWIMRMCENYRRWYRAAIDAGREEKVNISCFDLYAINLQYSGSACSWIILGSCELERMWTSFDLCLDCPSNCFRTHATIAHFFLLALFTIIVIAYHHLSKLIFYLHIMCTLHFQSVTCFCELHSIKNKVSISLLKSPLRMRMNSARCPWAARRCEWKSFQRFE